MTDSIPNAWKTKRWLWTRWHTLRYSLAKPQTIGPPKAGQERIETVALGVAQPGIPAEKVQVSATLPQDEKSLGMRISVAVAVALNKYLRPMGQGLPEIDQAIGTALAYGLSLGV